MKKITFTAAFLIAVLHATAQIVSFSDTEISRLKKLIKSEQEVKAAFEPFRAQASRSLEQTPGPVKTIISQGVLAGNPAKTASLKAVEDVNKIYAMALMFRLYNDKAYLKKATEFLLAWSRINQPEGNPINDTKLEDAVIAYDLIRRYTSDNDRSEIDGWLDKLTDEELKSIHAKGNKGTAVNNWNSHRLKMIIQIAYTLKNDKYQKQAEEELKRHLENNLNPDGSTFDFRERDALNYHNFSLEPLLKACITIQRAKGTDYFRYQTPAGASIEHSVDFLVPFVSGEKSHKEYLNSKVKFDRDRAANNEKGFQIADFVPAKGIFVLSAASWFKPQYLDVIKKATDDRNYTDWQLVVNRVRK